MSRFNRSFNLQYDFLIKLLLIGDADVEKTRLLRRYTDLSFVGQLGIDMVVKSVSIDTHRVKLQIWDTAGQERFRAITSTYFRDAHGCLVIYDISIESTFYNVRNWMRYIEECAPENIHRILIGNNNDVDESKREVSYEQGKALAGEYGMKFFETSVKLNTNIDEAFMSIAKDILEKFKTNSANIRFSRGIIIRDGRGRIGANGYC